jgi:hypothetical protein
LREIKCIISLTRTNKDWTDLGGELPVTLRVSISMLSVLLLVNDSELDEDNGSIDVRRVINQAKPKLFCWWRRAKERMYLKKEKRKKEEENVNVMRRDEARAAKTYLKPLNGHAKSR